MRAARLLPAVLLFCVLAPSAQARHAEPARAHAIVLAAPGGLNAFRYYPSDSSARTFATTPSFAWHPVAGAAHYELLLSTRFAAGSGVVWDDATLTTPVASVPIALPWITGNPYSLYARVRAITAGGAVGRWSAPYGFNMRWPTVPKQESALPGLVRWTPVDGATAYQVAFKNLNINKTQLGKIITTVTNVADEREYYTLHHNAAFSGTVVWRVRALRQVYGATANGIPATTRGPWSPIYTSANPAFAGGPLSNLQAVSNTVSTATAPAAHTLMPGFAWSGDQGLGLPPDELYRVYVFTDNDCLNPVFTGAIVGSPAYAPRSTGALGLPTDAATLANDRTLELPDGKQPPSFTADGEDASPTEEQPASIFTPQSASTGTGSGSTGSSGSGSSGSGSGGTTLDPTTDSGQPSNGFSFPTSLSAATSPIDLWDTDWPSGRYYWTVVPVIELTQDAQFTQLAASAGAGSTTVRLADPSKFGDGAVIQIGVGATLETAVIKSVDQTSGIATLAAPLTVPHAPGDSVENMLGSVAYYDHELAQDACASGRVATFGKTSQPSVASPGRDVPYAAGLSPNGRLVAASSARPTFYGTPVVTWSTAAGASAYEVQWSRTAYPWHPAAGPFYTFSTSATLSLAPGTWYYRVRGIDLALPTGAQQMAWSDPVSIVVAKPRFKVVGK